MERYLVELDGDQIELLMGMVREAMKVADENKIPECPSSEILRQEAS